MGKWKTNSKVAYVIGVIIVLFITIAAIVNCTGGVIHAIRGDWTTLRYGSPAAYDPQTPLLKAAPEIASLLFAGLTAKDSKGEVIPGLAESWKCDETGTNYTFKLRENLTFHDGTPLTSKDAKFTIESIIKAGNNSNFAADFTYVEKIEAPDPLTVNIKLSVPNAALPESLSVAILPPASVSADFAKHPIGAGPFKIAENQSGQTITLTRFEDFYLGNPKLKKVTIQYIPKEEERLKMLKSGKLDLTSISTAAELKNNPRYAIYSTNTTNPEEMMYQETLYAAPKTLSGPVSGTEDIFQGIKDWEWVER